MYLEQKVEEIFNILGTISKDIATIRGDIAEINLRLNSEMDAPPIEDILKDKYQDFKEQWKDEVPDMKALKDTLVKLKSSLSAVLAHPPDDQPVEDTAAKK